MGVFADDLNKPPQIRRLGNLNEKIALFRQRQQEKDRIAALQEYLAPQTELTPETQSSIEQVQAARNIPVEPKRMGEAPAGPENPERQMVIAPPQTITRQPEISDADPEQLSKFGLESGDILNAQVKEEGGRRSALAKIQEERTKSHLDTEKESSLEGLRGNNAIALEQERAKTHRPKLDKYQSYLDASGGDQEKALNEMVNDEIRVRKAGRSPGSAKREYPFLRAEKNQSGAWENIYGYKDKNGEPVEMEKEGQKQPASKKKEPNVDEFIEKLDEESKKMMSLDDFKADFKKEYDREPTEKEINNAKNKHWKE